MTEMIKAYYLFSPKPELLNMGLEYKYLPTLTQPRIWTNTESYVSFVDEAEKQQFHEIRMKLIFLANYARDYQKGESQVVELIHTLFGNPPRFNLDNFDKWWQMQRFLGETSFFVEINRAELGFFQLLEKTDNSDINEWLDLVVSGLKEEEEEKQQY